MMRQLSRLFLLVFFIFFGASSYSYAQKKADALIDSLLTQLPNAKEDTNKVNLLKALSLCYSRVKADEGIKYGRQGLALAEKLHWKKGIAGANYSLAANFLNKQDHTDALKYLLQQLKTDENDLYEVYRNIGLAYSHLGEYPKALEYYLKSLDVARKLGSVNDVARVTINISICYEDMGDYSNAQEYLFRVLQNSNGMNIGTLYNSMGEATSLGYDFKALKISRELQNIAAMVALEVNNGNGYKDPEDSIKTQEYLFKKAIARRYEKKQDAANTGKQLEQLSLEDRLKQQQIAFEFQRKADSTALEEKLVRTRLEDEFDQRTKKSEEVRLQLEKDKKKNDEIAAANLKSERSARFAAIAFACFLSLITAIVVFAYRQNRKDNRIIKKLVDEQEQTIVLRTRELAESNEKLAYANKKLVELVQFNAHKMREPLTRVMGALTMLEYMAPEDFCKEITPEIQRAIGDLDSSIMQVITLADDAIEQYK